MHLLRTRLPLGSAGEAVLDDPTRNLQMAAGFLVFLLGLNVLASPPEIPTITGYVIFGLFDQRIWGGLRIAFGLAQMIVGPLHRQHWRWKLSVAQVHVFLAGYVYVATTLTTTEPVFAATQLWLLLVEVWIGARALWDRDLNGTDRRLHG